jgi:cell division protein FtsW (lipid II flippase)
MSASLFLKLGLVALLGALGYLYYALVGCQSGACPLTSSPYISTGYGALMGAFVGFGILPNRKRDQSEKE